MGTAVISYQPKCRSNRTLALFVRRIFWPSAGTTLLPQGTEFPGQSRAPVINVDKNRAYPAAVEALKKEGILPGRVHLRQCKYLNNVVEQDHRTVKKRTWLAKGYGSFLTAWRTLQGIEAMNMIRKGRARWVAKDDAIAQATFIAAWFDLAA
jgi:hypothetical protein